MLFVSLIICKSTRCFWISYGCMKMVRTYIRKTTPNYDLATLMKAVQDVRIGLLNPYQASKKYGIPRTTIVDRVNNRRGVIKDSRGRPTALDLENEKNLANGLKVMEKYGFGLTSKEMTELVTQFVKNKKLKTPFKDDTPGYEWSAAFRRRHNMSLKKPQAVELSRRAACDPFIIEEYYNTLESVITELKLKEHPERIWNLDESSFSKDPEKSKIVGVRGYASTRTIASSGKDNVTILLAANALGDKLPPLVIYKGKHIWDTWMSEHAFEGTTYAATKNGWIESKIFEKYMFQTVLPAISKDGPALLVYDGHSTHIQLKILEKAHQLDVTIIKLPSHASHLLQPLDLAVFKSMKDSWDNKLVRWQRLNISKKLSKDEFSRLIGEVWMELNPKIIRNGFKKGGIYPLNKNVIPEDKYDPDRLQRFKMKPKNIPSLRHLCHEVISNEIQKDINNVEKFVKIKQYDLGSLQTFKMKLKTVPSLMHLCYKVISKINCEDMQNMETTNLNIKKGVQVPSCSSASTEKRQISIVEDKLLEESEKFSFESLFLQKIKRSDDTIKPKMRKVSKGCEVITRKEYLDKLKKEEEEKQKKIDEKKSKKSKNVPKVTKKTKGIRKKDITKTNPISSSNRKKRLHREINDDSEDELGESDIILRSDTESLCDWSKYCEDITTALDFDDNAEEYAQEEKENFPDNFTSTQSNNEYEPDFVRRNPETGDWIVVKFATKKTIKHYVGNILCLKDDGIPQVKFLRKIKDSRNDSFHYPDVEDVSEVKHADDIVKFLGNPKISRRGLITFKEDLKEFNIQ